MRPFGRSTIWRERDNGCGEAAARRAGGEAAVGGAKPRQARPGGRAALRAAYSAQTRKSRKIRSLILEDSGAFFI